MNDLEQYFRKNDNRIIFKWMHYFEIYDRYFNKYRNKEIVILEIGVSQGGSLQMWKEYFGPKAKIYGMDIDVRCKEFEEENIEVLIGSQSDRKFLAEVKRKIPKVDILIDDGGHMMKQQIVTFEELYSHINDEGVYLAEDLHTSYWLEFGGGNKRPGTFIEYSKNFIDLLNAHHSEERSLRVNEFTNTAYAAHFYDSILVIEKRKMIKPTVERSGTITSPSLSPPSRNIVFREKVIHFALKSINKTLRLFGIKGFIWY